MLIFGLGNDSPFWCEINRQGQTVFLEDFQPWFDKITQKYPEIEAYPVSYPCNITQWKELLDQADKLALDLPAEVSGHRWDVILVDGPRGHKYSAEIPGRMSSIYEASRLVGKKGYVFVHDAQRIIEAAYSKHFLGSKHFVEKVRGRALMLIYRF
jgi:glucuronoxylan 4-O-methyltransferase